MGGSRLSGRSQAAEEQGQQLYSADPGTEAAYAGPGGGARPEERQAHDPVGAQDPDGGHAGGPRGVAPGPHLPRLRRGRHPDRAVQPPRHLYPRRRGGPSGDGRVGGPLRRRGRHIGVIVVVVVLISGRYRCCGRRHLRQRHDQRDERRDRRRFCGRGRRPGPGLSVRRGLHRALPDRTVGAVSGRSRGLVFLFLAGGR
ncbi:unnamed protein product, partial [Scytosiphon promiscuus]